MHDTAGSSAILWGASVRGRMTVSEAQVDAPQEPEAPTEAPTAAQRARELLADEGGQAMTEYVIVMSLILIGLAGTMSAMRGVIVEYYETCALIIALPIF